MAIATKKSPARHALLRVLASPKLPDHSLAAFCGGLTTRDDLADRLQNGKPC